jgi:hypothetical protein
MQMTTSSMKKEYMTGTSAVARAKRICFTCIKPDRSQKDSILLVVIVRYR